MSTGAFAVSTTGSHEKNQTELLKSANQVINFLNDLEQTETEYFVIHSSAGSVADENFSPESQCQKTENFQPGSSEDMAQFLEKIVLWKTSLPELKGQPETKEKAQKFLQTVGRTFTDALSQVSFTVCKDQQGGSYSDGADVRYIRVNGELILQFSYSLPD